MAQINKYSRDTFSSVVVPIMDKVRDDLNSKKAEEYDRHANSFGVLLASAAGPDGGMAASQAYNGTIYYIGEWKTKTAEDYIDMVKAELKKKGIQVDAVMEKKMIDHMINQQMPKSTAEYILKKAAQGSIFYIPQRVRTSALQNHIDMEREKRFDPSLASEITGNILSWTSNAATTGGVGGFWGQTAIDGAVELNDYIAPGQQDNHLAKQREQGKKEVEEAQKKSVTIPKWMMTQMGFDAISKATDKQLIIAKDWAQKQAKIYRDKVTTAIDGGSRTVKTSGRTSEVSVSSATIRAKEYEAFGNAISKEQTQRKNAPKPLNDIAEVKEETVQTPSQTAENHSEQNNGTLNPQQSTGEYGGWNNIINMMGFNGVGDTFNHLGYSLSMLPDMLIGILTGKTKSIDMNKETMIPLASILCGCLTKNPLLKIPLMLYGGLNLFNRMSQEGLDEYRKAEGKDNVQYKHYADEQLNNRISNPHIEGNVLIVDFDHVPRIVTLPQQIVDGYKSGALPLNTIANRVLAKSDQMAESQKNIQQASEQYEQNQQQTVTRTLAQR